MVNSIYAFDQETLSRIFDNALKLENATPILEYGGETKCAFCGKDIKARQVNGEWIVGCDCPDALSFAHTRGEVLKEYLIAEAKLNALDGELRKTTLGLFKALMKDSIREQKIILENNDLLIDQFGGSNE